MPDWSRRQTLSALAGVAALAGCQGEAATSESFVGPPDSAIEDYEFERVRNDDAADFLGGDEGDGETRSGYRKYHHLTSREEVEELAFTDVKEARTLRAFVDDTDFESESIYLYLNEVPACYELQLERVEVDTNGPSAHFCRDLRPVDVECSVDAHATVGYAIRLPFPDEYSGLGSGMSSTCDRPEPPEPFEADVTLRDGSEDR